jgi:hypothetical protein
VVQQAELGLKACRCLLGGDQYWQIGDRALTLQMLKGLAPRFFAKHALQAELDHALERLDELPATFEVGLELDQAMSRVDALHLRKVNGLRVKTYDAEQLELYIAATLDTRGLLPAWLMSEQVKTLGVAAPVALPARFPFVESHWLMHVYFVTHLFMLDTDYFLRPAEPARFWEELDQLERAVKPLIDGQYWDLLAETELCLASCDRQSPAALSALRSAQQDDGSWAERGQDARQAGHSTAACLIAVAAE